jgi:hypothetical protein
MQSHRLQPQRLLHDHEVCLSVFLPARGEAVSVEYSVGVSTMAGGEPGLLAEASLFPGPREVPVYSQGQPGGGD